ncbi:alpha/beta fold hydrolase [Microbacterium sp. CFBP9034]|uniref:alpha/beta fold hydrolase n=1 Tax=Microbacterium sp. CFBP9034 TaxID=3096540 RepID=UPI002A6A8700|nr:alpha/beta fold hydrolase [Microbacterium sp. CFBP9034]MDY0907978.1 alpha/beta fold hydrolase [Microbacterium sp. CFBP9034]
MDLALSTAGVAVRAAGAVSPRWGAAVALPLFGHVSRPRPVGAGEQATMWQARRSTLRIPGIQRSGPGVVAYEWGHGTDVVVLAHGWTGRASQFAALVRELTAEGLRVVAFDAPAHGDSSGRRTYLVDWIDALTELQQRHGRFHAVVGHSFGGLAALVAGADGVQADHVITVAAPADADLLLSQFQGMLGYGDPTSAALRERFARRYFPGEADPFGRLSPVRRPLPAGVALLAVHDEADRMVPYGELSRIRAANGGARAVTTRGFGHNRILESDPFLDAVLEFIAPPAIREVPRVATAEAADAA